jgi:hypothetical protein
MPGIAKPNVLDPHLTALENKLNNAGAAENMLIIII